MALDFLEGLKVLDLGQDISAAFCARLFADLGACVIKVEPPSGDPCRDLGPYSGDLPDRERSGLFLALNTNKLGLPSARNLPPAGSFCYNSRRAPTSWWRATYLLTCPALGWAMPNCTSATRPWL